MDSPAAVITPILVGVKDSGFGCITMSILSMMVMGTFFAQFILDVGIAFLMRAGAIESSSSSSSDLDEESMMESYLLIASRFAEWPVVR